MSHEAVGLHAKNVDVWDIVRTNMEIVSLHSKNVRIMDIASTNNADKSKYVKLCLSIVYGLPLLT